MSKAKNLLFVITFLLLPGMVAAQQGEPLPIAVEGSEEAEALKRAHEADLKGALEDPEEAERRTQHLKRVEGKQAEPAAEPESEPGDAPKAE
jgi:hypothetical protein